MRKYKSKYLKPYIRRLKVSDRKLAMNSGITTYHEICMAIDTGRGGYVLVQHGAKKIVAYGRNKWKLKNQISRIRITKKSKGKTYNQWCNELKLIAQGCK